MIIGLTVYQMTGRWIIQLSDTVTVVIFPDENNLDVLQDGKEILSAVERTPGVYDAFQISPKENLALLEPWLGSNWDSANLPLPAIIEAKPAPGQKIRIPILRERLDAIGVNAIVDTHTEWIKRIQPITRSAQMLTFLTLFAVIIASASAVALACQAGLSAQSNIIAILRLLGADDGFIARLFSHRYSISASGGAFIGTVLVVLFVGVEPFKIPTSLSLITTLPEVSFTGIHWLLLFSMPVFLGGIARITARFFVMRTLQKL
jgi:cell division transport system permease protein